MTAQTVFQHQKAYMVRDLRPGLTECGKIKIGNKGKQITSRNGNVFQPPEKLDHFLITTLERGADGNFVIDRALHERFGAKPKELPVRLLFDDPWLNFQTTYAAMRGGARFCTGDGERAERVDEHGEIHEVECPCERLNPTYAGKEKCKINGTLSVMIEGAAVVGGTWKLRTTSINTCQGIASSLALLSTVTEGHLAGVPLMLTVRPKAAVTPQGATTTVYIVGLEFRGSIDELQRLAHERALRNATFGQRMQRVEEQARAMLSAPRPISDDETTDLVDEFYPEEAARARGLQLAPRADDQPARPRPKTLDQLVAAHEQPEPAAEAPQPLQDEQEQEQAAELPPDPAALPDEAPWSEEPPPADDDQPSLLEDPGPYVDPAREHERPPVTVVTPGQKRPEVLDLAAASAHLLNLAGQVKNQRGAEWIQAAIRANPWTATHRPTAEALRDHLERCSHG